MKDPHSCDPSNRAAQWGAGEWKRCNWMRIDKRTELTGNIDNGTGIAKFLTIPIPMRDRWSIFSYQSNTNRATGDRQWSNTET